MTAQTLTAPVPWYVWLAAAATLALIAGAVILTDRRNR